MDGKYLARVSVACHNNVSGFLTRTIPMSTVLVTGATGFLGRHLLRELVATGAAVRGLSRSPDGDATVAALGAFPVRGDLGDTAALAAATAGTDAVFHTAADTSTWAP